MPISEKKQSFELLRANLDRIGWADRYDAYAADLEQVILRPCGQTPAASVVIIARRPDPAALGAIDQALAKSGAAYELIFLDNGSRSEAAEAVAPFCHAFIRLGRDTGAYLGRNVAAAFARAPVLVFLDDDALPIGDFLAAHLEEHARYETILVRGVCLPKTPSPFNSRARHYHLGDTAFPRFSDLEGNTSVATAPFFAVGGWDDRIRFGHGGIDLTYRLLARFPHPQLFLYSPRPAIRHDYGASAEHLAAKTRKQALAWRYLQSKFADIDAFMARWDSQWSALPLVPRGERHKLVTVALGCGMGEGENAASTGAAPSKRDSMRNLVRYYQAKGDLARVAHYQKLAEEAECSEGAAMKGNAAGGPPQRRKLNDRQILALSELLACGCYEQVLAARDAVHPDLPHLLTAALLREGDLAGAETLLGQLPETEETLLRRKALSLLPRLAEPLDVQPRVHLIVLCHNREKELMRSFEQLARTSYDNYAVYIADNGSTDATWERVQEARRLFPEHVPVTLERLPTNIGRPAGHNWLLTKYDHCAADYIAIGDDDLVSVSPDWLEMMVKTALLFPNAAAVGGKALDPGLPPIVHAGVRNITQFTDKEFSMTNSAPQVDVGQFDCIDLVDHVIGCLQLYDRAMLFDEAGLFDIRFSPCQCVDIEHHLRIRTLGRDIVYNGFIRFEHLRAMGRKVGGDRALWGNSLGNIIKLLMKYDDTEVNRKILTWRSNRQKWLAEDPKAATAQSRTPSPTGPGGDVRTRMHP